MTTYLSTTAVSVRLASWASWRTQRPTHHPRVTQTIMYVPSLQLSKHTVGYLRIVTMLYL